MITCQLISGFSEWWSSLNIFEMQSCLDGRGQAETESDTKIPLFINIKIKTLHKQKKS